MTPMTPMTPMNDAILVPIDGSRAADASRSPTRSAWPSR